MEETVVRSRHITIAAAAFVVAASSLPIPAGIIPFLFAGLTRLAIIAAFPILATRLPTVLGMMNM
jgi:hypothetical protein